MKNGPYKYFTFDIELEGDSGCVCLHPEDETGFGVTLEQDFNIY